VGQGNSSPNIGLGTNLVNLAADYDLSPSEKSILDRGLTFVLLLYQLQNQKQD
jgi:hypothetical protein